MRAVFVTLVLSTLLSVCLCGHDGDDRRRDGAEAVVWRNLFPNPGAPGDYRAHKIAAIGRKIYEFGGLTENRTLFWLSGGQDQGWIFDSFNFIRYYDTQTNRYVRPPMTSGVVPPPRAWFGMASVGNKIFMFGGIDKAFNILGDFFVADVSNPQIVVYTNLTKNPPNTFPGRRVGCIFETVEIQGRTKIVMFSGLKFGPPGGDLFINLNDTWIYDVAANTWSLLFTTNTPAGRARGAATIFNGQMYLHGGELFDNTVINPDSGQLGYVHYVNDLYSLNFQTAAWTTISPNNPYPRTNLHFGSVRVGQYWHFHGGDFGNCTQLDLIHQYTDIYDITRNFWYIGYLPEYSAGPAIKGEECAYVPDNGLAYCTGGYMGTHYNGFLCTNAEQTYPKTVYSYRPTNFWLQTAVDMIAA